MSGRVSLRGMLRLIRVDTLRRVQIVWFSRETANMSMISISDLRTNESLYTFLLLFLHVVVRLILSNCVFPSTTYSTSTEVITVKQR